MDACDVGELGRMGFAMPYEVGFVIDLNTIDNIPRGCGNLDGPWIKQYAKPACAQKAAWSCGDLARPSCIHIGSKGYDGSPDCAKNSYAPEGIASADIVNEF